MSSAAAALVSRARVLSGYRRLFRARKNLFQGDDHAMQESRKAIREQFVLNQTAPTSGEHFEGLLTMIDEAEDMLRHGIVRGDLNPQTGHYEVKIKPEHVEGQEHTNVEPITPQTAAKMQKPMVEKSCQSNANQKN